MKFFRFDREVRRDILTSNSYNVGITPVLRNESNTQIGCMHFDQNSVLGMHPATVSQLFLVVNGEGWVSVNGEEKVHVTSGTAIFWEPGVQHESGTETGMSAMIIEVPNLDPNQFLKELE